MTDPLGTLTEAGVAVWLDDLSRDRLRTGNLGDLIRDRHLVGITTNPSIFQKAITSSDSYDPQLRDLALRGVDVGEGLRALTTYDVRWACDVLRPVYDATDGVDGRRDLDEEVRPIDQPPQRAQHAGHDLSRLGSVASFFVSRVDSEVDKRLDKLGSDEAKALRGKAAVANARLAYELFEQKSASERWQRLAAAGARPQRPLWASTSTKDPAYEDVMYVVDLVAPGTVNTMPENTLQATYDHGEIPNDSVRGNYANAREVLEGLGSLGIGYDEVVNLLEREGVEKFEQAWNELTEAVAGELERLGKEAT